MGKRPRDSLQQQDRKLQEVAAGQVKMVCKHRNIAPNVGIIKKGVILSKKDKVKGHFKRKVIITGLAVFTALFLF